MARKAKASKSSASSKAMDKKGMKRTRGGSASSGAGAGKVTFNPFSVTRKIDVSSP